MVRGVQPELGSRKLSDSDSQGHGMNTVFTEWSSCKFEFKAKSFQDIDACLLQRYYDSKTACLACLAVGSYGFCLHLFCHAYTPYGVLFDQELIPEHETSAAGNTTPVCF